MGWRAKAFFLFIIFVSFTAGTPARATEGEPSEEPLATEPTTPPGATLEALQLSPNYEPSSNIGAACPPDATCYVSRGCAIAIQRASDLSYVAAQTSRGMVGRTRRTQRPPAVGLASYVDDPALPYPDWVRLKLDQVADARFLYQTKWALMYGARHQVSSPPPPVTPMAELKIGTTIATKGEAVLPIPTEIITGQNLLEEADEPKVRELGSKLDMYVEQLEQKEGESYRPESVVRVANAIGRIKENTAMAGVEGLLRPLLSIVQESLEDYLAILDIAVEVDRLQFEINTQLTSLVARGLLNPFVTDASGRRVRGPIFELLKELDVVTFDDQVTPLSSATLLRLDRLLEEDSPLSPNQRHMLAGYVTDLKQWCARLGQARKSYSGTYPAGMMSYFFITMLGKPDGFSEMEMNNFMRASWIKSLNGRNRLWVILGVRLLCQRSVVQQTTDEVINLQGLTPAQIIEKYMNDPRLHEMVASLFIRKDYLDIEFNSDRMSSLGFALDSLKERLGADGVAKAERRLRRGAISTVQHVLNLPFAKKALPAPALNVVLETLEDADKADEKSGRTISVIQPQIRPLPASFPAYFAQVIKSFDRVRPMRDLYPDPQGLSEGDRAHNAHLRQVTGTREHGAATEPAASAAYGAEIFGSLLEELLVLDRRAEALFSGNVIFQRQEFKAESPIMQEDATAHARIKVMQRDRVELARRIMSMLHALELAFIQEDGAAETNPGATKAQQTQIDVQRARADARATLAYHMVDLAPSLTRLAVHENSLSSLKGFQRRLVIEIIKAILDNPEEMAAAFAEAQGSRWKSLTYVRNKVTQNKWKIMIWTSILGAGSVASWFGYNWWTAGPAVLPNTPGASQPAPANPAGSPPPVVKPPGSP
jgi:hypothetical protein